MYDRQMLKSNPSSRKTFRMDHSSPRDQDGSRRLTNSEAVTPKHSSSRLSGGPDEAFYMKTDSSTLPLGTPKDSSRPMRGLQAASRTSQFAFMGSKMTSAVLRLNPG